MPMKVTGLKTHQKRVSIGPMDRFLGKDILQYYSLQNIY